MTSRKSDAPETGTDARTTGDAYSDSSNKYNFDKVPCCMYFYYIYGTVEAPHVLHYFHTIDDIPIDTRSEAEARARTLIDNARAGGEHPKPDGQEWDNIYWTRKSIIALFIDIEGVRLLPKALRFTTDHHGTENYGFFDGWQTELRGRPIIFCTNHMKRNRQGSDIEEEEERYYHFDILSTPELQWPYRTDITGRYPDSGGTNMGPPVPPPF